MRLLYFLSGNCGTVNPGYRFHYCFFCAITIVAAVLFILSNIVVGDAAFVIAWIGIIHYILGAPANLVNAVAIGLIGKDFVNRFSTDINQD